MNDLVVSPHPLSQDGRDVVRGAELLPGETLITFLGRHDVDLSRGDWVVSIGGAQVPRLMWDRTRPKHGHLIECRRRVGKQVIALVAIVFIAWVTMGTGLAALGVGAQAGMSAAGIAASGVSGLAGALGMSAGFAALAVNAGAMMLGSMLVNKLLPPARLRMPSYDGGTVSQTYSISGGRNAARPYEPLALLFGQVRVTPDLAAQPYQSFWSDDQILYVRLHAGINCGTVDDIRNGDTLLSTYQSVEVSRSGFPGDSSYLTEWSDVDTIAGGTLDAPTAPGVWVVRTTSADTVRIAVDVGASLYQMNDEGAQQRTTLDLEAEYRLLPSGDWLPLVDGDSLITLSSNATKPVRRTFLSGDLASGQYEVRLRKATANVASTRAANTLEWGSLKSYQLDNHDYARHPHVAVRIRASGQISGALDAVNWLATAAATPVWTGSAWVTQVTSNPGAQILQVARGIFDTEGRLMAGMGLPDSQIDIEGLKAFMLHCEESGFTFDHWFDSPASCGDVLDAMAAAGRGSISYHPGKLSVVWVRSDQPLRAVVAMPNIKRGSFRVDYSTRALAEELEVSWPDRDHGWRQRSLRVKAPGVAVPRDTARLAPLGVSTEPGALQVGRFTMAQNIYQRKSVTWEMDLEYLDFRRFSLVALTHDMTKWGSGGRLRAASTAAGVVTLVLDEEVKPRVGATAWYVGLRLPGEQSYRVFEVEPVMTDSHTLVLAEDWPVGLPLPGSSADDPAHDTLWIFDFKAQPGQRLRISSIEPTGDLSGARITAVPESDAFWTFVNTGAFEAGPPTSAALPIVVTDLQVTQDRLGLNYDARTQLTVTFKVSGPYDHAQIWAAPLGDPPQFIGSTRTARLGDWTVDTLGEFSIEVRPFSALGRPGTKASGVITVALDPLVTAPRLEVRANPQYFAINSIGEASPSVITFAALSSGLAGVPVFTVVDGMATLGGSGMERTLAFDDMDSDTVLVEVTQGGLSDRVTVSKLRDGIDGVAGVRVLLSNEMHVLPASALGVVTSYASAKTIVRVWLGLVDNTADWTIDITPSAGVTAELDDVTDTVSVTDMDEDSGYVDISVSRSGYPTPPPVRFSLAKARAGSHGTRTAVMEMYKWSAAAPTTFPSGTSTYTWATGQFVAPATPNGWSLTPPAPVVGQTLYVVRDVYADSLTTLTTDIAWSVTTSSAVGTAGANGQRVGLLEVYKWATSAPGTYPTGTSTYNWATGAFTAPTTANGWSLLPGAPVPGQTLWGISVSVSDALTTATSVANWTSTTVYAVGAAGTNGINGDPGSDGLNHATVFIYQRSVTGPPSPPTSTANYNFSTASLTGLNNGWSANIPGGTGPLYVSAATAATYGTSDNIGSGEWASVQLMAQSGTPGGDGINSATVFLYYRANFSIGSVTAPAGTLTYNFSSGVISGATLAPWSQTVPAASAGKYLYVITATALSTGPTDTIASGEWSAVRVMAQDGSRGTVNVAWAVPSSGYIWNWGGGGSGGPADTAASAAVSSATGGDTPKAYDIVTLYVSGTNYSETRFLHPTAGFGWVAIDAYLSTRQLMANAATEVYQDAYYFGGGGFGNYTPRSFTVTPPDNCNVELTATISADNVYNDGGNSIAWKTTPAGGSTTTQCITQNNDLIRRDFAFMSLFSATGGVPITFDLVTNNFGGGPAIHLWHSKIRIAMVKR